jgi:hypothetical protein
MIVTCYICGIDFEVDEEVFLEDYDPLNVDEFDVCDECYEDILSWIIERN